MSNQLEPVVGRIVGENTDYVRALNDSERRTASMTTATQGHFDRLGAGITKMAKVAAVGLAGLAVGAVALVKKSVDAAEESRKVAAQTEAVIKSTGGVANVSADQVGRYADKLAALTGIDDEVVAGTENMLLTFTNVRNGVGANNDIFNQATKTALDMSVALGTDSKDAALQLGKALNDPIKGVTALQRVGVTFTAQQKEQIKTLVDSGRTMDAQKVILRELATEFGGSAEAAASPMARLKVVVGNLEEELGGRLLPVIGKVAGFLADKLPGALDAAGRGFQFLIAGFKDPAAAQGPESFLDVLFNLGAGVRKLVDQFKAWWPAIKETVLDAVEAIVGWVKANWPEIRKTITDTMKTVQSVIKGVIDIVTVIWRNFGDQITDYTANAFHAAMDIIQGALTVIRGIILAVTSLIKGDWSGVWEGIKQIFAGAWQAIQGLVDQAMNYMRTTMSIGMETVSGIFSGAWDGIKGAMAGAMGWILDTFLGFVERFLDLAAHAFGWIPGIGPKLRQAADWVATFRDEVNEYIAGIQGEFVVTADTRQAWAELEALASYARNINSIELQTEPGGGTTGGNQRFARGMEMGPVQGRMGEAVPIIAHAGEWVLTPEQLAALRRNGGGGGYAAMGGGITIIINTATGDIPDETIRKIRSQLFELGNDVPGGQIIPAA